MQVAESGVWPRLDPLGQPWPCESWRSEVAGKPLFGGKRGTPDATNVARNSNTKNGVIMIHLSIVLLSWLQFVTSSGLRSLQVATLMNMLAAVDYQTPPCDILA